MRILVHDYSGHPFQIALSRWLAAQGHTVRHVYSTAVETPRGPLERTAADPAGFDVRPLARGTVLDKYRPHRRLVQEAGYADTLANEIDRFRPHSILSGNCSPLIQLRAARASRRAGAGFVYWLQDIYAEALLDALRHKGSWMARVAAPVAHGVEARALRAADAVVPIAESFAEAAVEAKVCPTRIRTIPNWASPLPASGDGGAEWAEQHGLNGRFVFLYTGTLGQKHDPGTLAALARHFAEDPRVAVVVASQGPGRDALDKIQRTERLANLYLMDFLPYDELAEALRAADVLLVTLSAAASRYAVPSKVLTALRSGRPILAAMPASNPAAATLRSACGGVCVEPGDRDGWLAAARRLRRDPEMLERLGGNGVAFAKDNFDIERIGRSFLDLLQRVQGGR